MSRYYNENDPRKVAMLRQMITDGLLPDGDIDDRGIQDVRADEVRGYRECHFFAGIGGWSIALRLAGWPKGRTVWTGSCPCQPFSTAGKQKAKEDERHLWPVWERLIRECHPSTIFGEQVESAVSHGWLDDVYQGLEAEGYAVGSAVLPACSVGAPHRRNRLWFVGDAKRNGFSGQREHVHARHNSTNGEKEANYAINAGQRQWTGERFYCSDGRSRLIPAEPVLFPLAHGIQHRRWLLHAAGDAIVPEVASRFIKAFLEAHSEVG